MRLGIVAVIVAALVISNRALAWHDIGHQAVARIAWEQFDDGQKKQAYLILQNLPYKEAFFQDRPADVDEPMWMFCKAATWCDWIRFPTGPNLSAQDKAKIRRELNKPVWHYVNLPFVHPDDVNRLDADADAIRKEILEPEFDANGEPRHVLAALKFSQKKLQARDTSPADRAVYLCWMLHLVGDLHQPLHGTSLIASKETLGSQQFDPPHGDKGGNRCVVRVQASDLAAVELHAFWDSLQFRDHPKFAEMEARVLSWLKERSFQREQFPELRETEYLTWAEESLALAKSNVYRN
ncbi:MAG TPA: S1/P1 nuclease, partial [Gemmataceae bacterium]|nr:S1/P1 nuclease [Gemmataceae bacterium]